MGHKESKTIIFGSDRLCTGDQFKFPPSGIFFLSHYLKEGNAEPRAKVQLKLKLIL